ncbi:uncharacterized protein [Coffea arabica]|uniref:Uncharacterized protein n=1 Tax=Coffea arabica TaxID=13443 RepID=A0A6P6VPV9_COFAR|nr:uncharacterized protein LOC113725875 [Coffea arabica]
MAFYGFKGDVDECYWAPYMSSTCDYDALLPPPASLAYSSYEVNEPRLYSYNFFDSYATQPVQNYSVHSFSEPRLIQYERPPSYGVDSFYSRANFTISYSTLEFNEPEWDEYDPTPYGGGYDQTQTYGKPLPPSDAICYPRSSPQPNGELLGGFSYASTPSAYGEKDGHSTKPDDGRKPTDTKEQEQESLDGGADTVTEGTDDNVKDDDDLGKALEEKLGDVDGKLPEREPRDFDEIPSSDYGRNGGYGHEWNKQVPYIPHGSGLESLDLCESIFGYWPCLAKIERQQKCPVCDEANRNDPWKSTADYLFGSPYGYGEQQDGGSGNYYDRSGSYYQDQHQYLQQ